MVVCVCISKEEAYAYGLGLVNLIRAQADVHNQLTLDFFPTTITLLREQVFSALSCFEQ